MDVTQVGLELQHFVNNYRWEQISWTNIKGRYLGLTDIHAILVNQQTLLNMSLLLLVKCAFDWTRRTCWINQVISATANDQHPVLWYTRCTIKHYNFVAQVHLFQLPPLYPEKASGQMATVTGYPMPIPADELASFDVLLQGVQMDRRTRGRCGQRWESSVNLHVL